MAEKELFENLTGEKYSEQPGLPANVHAKKKAKEKKEVKAFKELFTIKDGKILSVKVKENGTYFSYVGTKKKLGDQFELMLKKWNKEGIFVNEYDLKDKAKEVRSQLLKGK